MIEKLRKRPEVVETMLWDGTDEASAAIKAWVGDHHVGPLTPSHPGWLPPDGARNASLYVALRQVWSGLPVGYRVAKDPVDGNGFYPLSPERAAAEFEPPGTAGPRNTPATEGAPADA